MRNKNRIDKILQLLGILWSKNPDYRFGQLLINYSIVEDSITVWNNPDDGLETYLKECIKKYS